MQPFMDKDFLLKTETAKKLYHDYAAKMPIYDYHCHIDVGQISEDKTFENLTQVWLYGDHYKWRAMRLFGIDEKYITGDASDYEKYLAYANMMPYLIGNPIYHWTHLELKKYFDIHETLSKITAKRIWDKAEKKLQGGYSVIDMITESNVVKICSTDDPIDDLAHHKAIAKDENIAFAVLPTFRPDKGIEIRKATFFPWIEKLSKVCDKPITHYAELLECLKKRVLYFDDAGCIVADHGMDYISYAKADMKECSKIFEKAMMGDKISDEEEAKFRSYTIKFLAAIYEELNWTMQLHIGAMRSNNAIMVEKLGVDTGFDSINDREIAQPLSRLLDDINENGLPKTIVYTLNPKDNYVLATMMGNFPGKDCGSKVQFGCAWWFNDQKDGMTEQLKAFANLGVISKFVGMLTDSRSFLSYTRHEYFRRILCNLLGDWVENGEYPNDIQTLGKIVEDISVNNALKFIAK
jgi:glucuronate isomerase